MELVGLSYIGLKTVVDFLYSGELLLDGGNIVYVLEAAHLLQVRCYAFPDYCCFLNLLSFIFKSVLLLHQFNNIDYDDQP